MSVLTDLRALVNQCECDENCNDCTARPCYYEQLRDTLDTDTIRALLDVAEAVCDHLQDTCSDCATRFCEDDSDIGCSLDDMRTALAPLVKEADHE